MIIDATDTIVGRLGTFVSKLALTGHKVDIINAEKAVITGNKKNVLAKYKQRAERGSVEHGPFFPKQPDRFLRRILRGMFNYKAGRGKEAFANVMCHVGIPVELEGKEAVKVENANVGKLPNLKFITVKEITSHLK